MARFLVINQHSPEECDSIGPGLEHPPAHLKGTEFYCPCPYGEHAFYMVLEGSTVEGVIQSLPVAWRPGTRAVEIEVFDL